MTRTYHTWIITPTRKFAADGRLQIGQILAKPFEHEHCLRPCGPLPLPKDILPDRVTESNVTTNSSSELTAMFKLWAENTAIPFQAKMGGMVERSNQSDWQFDSLVSTQVTLPWDYTAKSIETPEVFKHLKDWHVRQWLWNKRIFIVTGVTVAKGAKMAKSDTRTIGGHAAVQGDISSAPVPVPANMDAEISVVSKKSDEARMEVTDFVISYSVNEVFFEKQTQKPYRRGEVSSVGENASDREDDLGDNEIIGFTLSDVCENAYVGEGDG